MTPFVRQRIWVASILSRTQCRKLMLIAFVLLFISVHLLVGFVTLRTSSSKVTCEERSTRAAVAEVKKADIPGKNKQNKPAAKQAPPKPGDIAAQLDGGKFVLTRFGLVPMGVNKPGVTELRGEIAVEPDFSQADFNMDFLDDDPEFSRGRFLTALNTTNETHTGDANQWKPVCPVIPPELEGVMSSKYNDSEPPTLLDTAKANPEVLLGGRSAPKDCQSRSKIAIIIPLRGRQTQLRLLMAHMHPVWQRQQLDYTVYTITQEDNGQLFNKAKLMNAGFLEASKDRKYDCYVFHDVDMTLEDDRCLYHCPTTSNPREIAYFLDKFDYKKKAYSIHCPPKSFGFRNTVQYFGGVTQMTKKMFENVNGYSNVFWGWGGEDDDMYLRLWNKGYALSNPYDQMCSFHMVKHETESSNSYNEGRYAMLRHAISRMKYEGLNTLKYRILSVKKEPLYTNITVDVGHPMEKLTTFMTSEWKNWEERCNPQMPWE